MIHRIDRLPKKTMSKWMAAEKPREEQEQLIRVLAMVSEYRKMVETGESGTFVASGKA